MMQLVDGAEISFIIFLFPSFQRQITRRNETIVRRVYILL